MRQILKGEQVYYVLGFSTNLRGDSILYSSKKIIIITSYFGVDTVIAVLITCTNMLLSNMCTACVRVAKDASKPGSFKAIFQTMRDR